jgi:hypothetical protein
MPTASMWKPMLRKVVVRRGARQLTGGIGTNVRASSANGTTYYYVVSAAYQADPEGGGSMPAHQELNESEGRQKEG